MSKKMMLLATALAALASAALPAMASAGEPEVECSGVACGAFIVSGGATELARAAGGNIGCASVTGTGSYTTKTTGSMKAPYILLLTDRSRTVQFLNGWETA